MKFSNHRISLIVAMAVFALLTACQPTPEERMSRAEAYFAEADYRTAAIELRNVLQAEPDNGQARLLLARSSYQLGDFATAVSQFERALGLGHTTVDVWLGFGRSLLSQGRAQDAFTRVVPNLDASSENEAVQNFLGDVSFSLANYEDAGSYYSRAVGINPSSAGGLVGQAMIRAANNEDEDAQRLLNQAAEANPATSFVWLAQGNFHRSNRGFIDAISAYENAIRVETAKTPIGETFSARMSLVSSLIDSRRLGDAETRLAEFTAKFPDHPVSGFLSGRLAFEKGDYEDAQLQLQDYLAKNPGDARGQAILGAINFSQDNLRQAELHLLSAVRANAGGDATRRLLAETQLRLNKPEGALESLRSIDAMDQSDGLYLAMLGRAQIATGDTEGAISYFQQSLAQEPGNVAVKLALATAYLNAERVDDAVTLLDSMPVEAGSELRRQTILIAALVRQGDHQRAISESDRLLSNRQDDPAAYVVAGALRQSIGEPVRARALYQEALMLDPENLSALYSISRMAISDGDLPGAESSLRTLLDSHATYLPGMVSLGMVLQRSGNLEDLRPYLTKAIEQSPDVIAPHIVLARMELALARPDETLNIVNSASSRFPGEPELAHLKGLALLAKGEFVRALVSLTQAASASPDNAGYQYDLAQAQLANDRHDEAFETARAFIHLRPQDSRGPALAVDAAIRSGASEKALEIVNDFAQANPDHPEIAVMLGDIDLASGNAASAIKHFEAAAARRWSRSIAVKLSAAHNAAGNSQAAEPVSKWLGEHPDDHDMRFMYAQLLEGQGKAVQAKSEYEWLLARGELDAFGLNNLAWLYSLDGNEQALQLAEQAHDLAPDSGNISDTLGWILAGRGDFERAEPLLRKAAQQLPESAEVRFHLASVLASSGAKSEASAIINELLRSEEPFPSRAEAERLADTL